MRESPENTEKQDENVALRKSTKPHDSTWIDRN